MQNKEIMYCRAVRCLGGILVGLGLLTTASHANAQNVSTLIQFTNVWKYDQSGLELGTAWRTNDYDDSAWPQGRGLLGVEPDTPAVYTAHAPISTPLVASTTVTTYYFRTTFQITGSTNGLLLMATNLLDDGAVIYLNGMPAARLRMPANSTANTFATGGPTVEGSLETVGLTNLVYLRPGANLLAAEVHQSSPQSTDVMWGLKLIAIEATPLVITNQPQDLAIVVGQPAVLSVGVSGGPAAYQWYRDGVVIPGANSATYSIANAQISFSGTFVVEVTNMLGRVFSRPATLTVLPDATGPKLLSAAVRDADQTNRIILAFDEMVLRTSHPASATNGANYRLTSCLTGLEVPITNVAWGGTQVQLSLDISTNWVMRGCYFLTVNNVADARTNRIAPNSQIPISWPLEVNLLTSDAQWDFHAAAYFDPGVYNENWTATNYVGSAWWAQGAGLFFGGPPPATTCLGTAQTAVGFQPEPTLFRTTFQWPMGLGNSATLLPQYLADDGLVLYLNGVEIFRQNVAAASGPITSNSIASTAVGNVVCLNSSVVVTNLVPGRNWLAAAVAQSASGGGGDLLFGLALSASTTTNGPLPATLVPSLQFSQVEGTNAVRLWWTGAGYALESSTSWTNSASYPQGPWQEVPAMSNPYTNSLTSPARFFRLKK